MKTWQRRILGLLAIFGGVVGVISGLIFDIIGTDTRFFIAAPISSVLTPFIAIALYGFGIWCGITLLKSHKSAIRNNLILWTIQIPLVESSLFSYEFTSGAMFAAYQTGGLFDSSVRFNIGCSYYFSLVQTDTTLLVGLNIFAGLISLFFLTKLFAKPSNYAIKGTSV